MNKDRINSIINIFCSIPLSLVVFGVFSLGFFVAPVIFRELVPRALASEIMTDIFLRFFPFAFVCTILTLIAELIRFLVMKKDIMNKVWYAQILALILVSGLTAYNNFNLAPKINQMRIEQKGPTLWNNSEFVSLHKQSESTSKTIFILGLIPLAIMVSNRKKTITQI